jgi:hypothetical protein
MAGWETRHPTEWTTIANISKFEKSHCKSVKMRKDSIAQDLHDDDKTCMRSSY